MLAELCRATFRRFRNVAFFVRSAGTVVAPGVAIHVPILCFCVLSVCSQPVWGKGSSGRRPISPVEPQPLPAEILL